MDENYHSGMNILQFYLEICANELRKTSITEDKFKSALGAVSSASSLESSEVTLNFGAPQNRAAYIYRFHPCLTWSLENYMKRALAENSQVNESVKKLLDNSNVKLCCIGSEVGADLIGFLSAISDYTIKPAFKSVTVVTKSASWRSTFNNILANLKSGILNPVHEHLLGNKFLTALEGCDLSKPLSSKILHKIKEANVFLITKLFPSNTLEGSKLDKAMEDILSAVSPASLVFFIDHSNGFGAMLRAIQSTHQDILFGPLQEQYRFPHLQDIFKGLFGYFPEMSSRTYFMVWEKTSDVNASHDYVSLISNSVEPNQSSIAVKTSDVVISNSLHDPSNSLPTKTGELVSFCGSEESPGVTVADICCVSDVPVPTNGLVTENNVYSCANSSVSVTVGGSAVTVNVPKGNQELLSSSPVLNVHNTYVTDNILANGSRNKISAGIVSEQEKLCHAPASSPSAGGSDSSGSDCGKFPEYPPSNDTSGTNHTAHKLQNDYNSNCHMSPCSKAEGEQVSDLVKAPRRRKRGRGGRKTQVRDSGNADKQSNSGVISQMPPFKLSTSHSSKALNNSAVNTSAKSNSYASANKLCQTVDTQKMPCNVINSDKPEAVPITPVNSSKSTASKSSACCPNKAIPRETIGTQKFKTYETVDSPTTSAINKVNAAEKVNLKDSKQKWRSRFSKFTQTEVEECIPKLGDPMQRCLLELTRRVDTLASVVEELVLLQRQGRCGCTNCYRSTPVARNNDIYYGARNVNPSLVLPISNLTESQVSQMLSLALSQALHPKNHSQ